MFAALVLFLSPFDATAVRSPRETLPLPTQDDPLPPLSDLKRFPCWAKAYENYWITYRCVNSCEDQCALYNVGSHPEQNAYWSARLDDAYSRRMVWSLIADAADENSWRGNDARRDLLFQLRTLIGWEAYEAGWMPNPKGGP